MGFREMLMCAGLLLGGCSGAVEEDFTREEKNLIGHNPDAGSMRVLTVDNREDSLFLRREALPLTKADVRSSLFETLCRRMLATVTDPSQDGVGIAAPQVGVSRTLIAVQRLDKGGEPFEFYVNPRIISPGSYSVATEIAQEGCLSVPGVTGKVFRAAFINIEYNDPVTFKKRKATLSGFTARIFQHEIDHLHGRLYTDLISKETEQ